MPTNRWFRLTALGLVGALCVSGCFHDDDDGGADPPVGPEPLELAPSSALTALAEVVQAIAEGYYLEADGSPVVIGGDTTAVENATLVRASGSWIEADLDSDDLGMSLYANWELALVDQTLTVREQGVSGPAKYVATVSEYGEVVVERDPWRTNDALEINGGVVSPLVGWDVDTDEAIGAVLGNATSYKAARVAARVDSLISNDFYVLPADTVFTPVFDGVYPADQVIDSVGTIRVSRWRDGVETITDYDPATHVLNHDATPTSTPDFTIVFWADSSQLDHGLFEPGDAIQGHLGQVIKTGEGQSDTTDIALYRVEDDTVDVYWIDVAANLVTGEVTGACDPCDAPNLAAANGQILIITNKVNEGSELEVTTHDPADVWFVDRDDENDRYAFVSDGSPIPNIALDFFEIDEVEVGDTTHVAVDPDDLGVDLDNMQVLAMVDLGNFGVPDTAITPGDPPDTTITMDDALSWRIDTRFMDDQFNELVIFGEVIDHVDASTTED
ncbi:MAG: hypothetical protein CME06_10955 [Gemmatimonadetes bacterium]|nr:hypothetical protein [Gemmatimonadota bacterium]